VPPIAGGEARYVLNPVPDTVLDADRVVKAPVLAVVAPTVPLNGPARPAAVSVVPLNVKLAESISSPPVVLYTTRPEVKPVLVIELNVPGPFAPPIRTKLVPSQATTVFSLAAIVMLVPPDALNPKVYVADRLLIT
jgi:hypothetical protein